MTVARYLACAFFGLCIGSFLNVVIYRVPRHLSILRPASACPSCHHEIRPYDNVPVFSWLILRGRCRDCRAPISPRYPLVEAATAGLFVAVAWRLGDNWAIPAYCLLVAGLLALAIIDAETLTLPRSIVWTHLALVGAALLAYSADTGNWRRLVVGVLCALAWSGFYLIMFLVSPRSIGLGDVRLALVLGLSLGYLDLAYPGLAFLVSNVVGVIITGYLIARRRLQRKQPVPYGVFLAIGTTLVLFFGRWMVDPFHNVWWRQHF